MADQATATWVYPTVMLRYTRVHSRAVFHFLFPLSSLCFSVRKALGHCLSVRWGSSCESPLAPCVSMGLFRLGSLFRLCYPPRSVASMLCCLPRVRPALLAASEFAQDLNPVHTYAPRCLILLIALRAFPVHPACCTHSCTDAKTSNGLPSHGPFLSSATCRTSVFRHWTSWFLPSSPTRV